MNGWRSPPRMRFAVFVVLVMLSTHSLAGCFGQADKTEEAAITTPFDGLFSTTTWYHYPGAVNASNLSIGFDNLTGNSTPYPAVGTYYGIGDTTFEPTIGVTSTGGIHFSSYGGTGSGTMVYSSYDQGLTWVNNGPFNPVFPDVGQVPSSNDPYIYVDKWTDRIIKFEDRKSACRERV